MLVNGGGRGVCVGRGRRLGLLRMDIRSAGVRGCVIRFCPQFSFHYLPHGAFGVGKKGERGLALKHTTLAALTVHLLLRLLPRGAFGVGKEGEGGLALKHTNLAALTAMCSSTSG